MPIATQLPMPRAVFYDVNGNPLCAGLVYTFVAGTTTPKLSWQDAGETTPNTNPVVLDANGSCLLYGTGIYTLQVTDALGNNVAAYSGLTTSLASITSFSNIANLRLNTVGGTSIGSVYVDGYYALADGGEGTFVYNPTDTTSADNGGTIIVDAAGNRWYRDTGTGAVSLKWFGAKGDGITNDAAILTSAFAASQEVWVPPSSANYIIGTNKTIANGNTLRFVSGAKFSISGGVTLTINCILTAPRNQQIFTGSGTVVGMRTAYPEWWGAQINNTGFDCQPAIQAAVNAVQTSSLNSDGDRPTVYLGAGQYTVGSTITLSPTANCQLQVIGEGTVFGGSRLATSSTFGSVPVVYVQGNSDATQQIADWVLRGFGIVLGGGTPTIGLKVGTTSDTVTRLIGQQMSLVEDVFVAGFTTGIQICHTRLVQWNRVSVWNNTITANNQCILITEAGWFTGDMTFNDCQVVGNAAGANRQGVYISSSTTGSSGVNSHLAGLRFNGFIAYNCDQYFTITCNNGSMISDIWLNPGCQFDAPTIHGIFIQSDGMGSFIRDIHIDGVFLNASTASGDAINVIASNSGNILDVFITKNWIWQAAQRAIIASGLTSGSIIGLHINDNAIADCNNTSGPAILVTGNISGIGVNQNQLSRIASAAVSWLVQIGLGTDYFVVTGNNGNGYPTTAVVSNLSAGTHTAIANNI